MGDLGGQEDERRGERNGKPSWLACSQTQKHRTMDHSKLTAHHLCLQGPNTALSLPNQTYIADLLSASFNLDT